MLQQNTGVAQGVVLWSVSSSREGYDLVGNHPVEIDVSSRSTSSE